MCSMEISRNWRLQPIRYGTSNGGLRGSICSEGHVLFPPRPVCPRCREENLDQKPAELSDEIEQFLALLVHSPIDYT